MRGTCKEYMNDFEGQCIREVQKRVQPGWTFSYTAAENEIGDYWN